MTHSRRLARYLSRFSWYCPSAADRRVMLDKAWAYFEHTTLPRYHEKKPGESSHDLFVEAEPGEQNGNTKLYPILSTPETDLADFGIGVGVYFYTLRMMSIIMLVAGTISIPNLIYFGSDKYNSSHEFNHHQALLSSAVCTDQSWEACPTCNLSQWDYFPASFSRYAEFTKEDGAKLSFIRINHCSITRNAGIIALVTMLFVCLAIYLLMKVTKRKENEFDFSQQTSSDYAMAISNPPPDAKDEKEWRDFFSRFGHVSSITIAYDNEALLYKLLARRKLVLKLEQIMPPGVEVDPQNINKAVGQAQPVSWYWKLYGMLDGETIQKQIADIDEVIANDLANRQYNVTHVFVIFESEASQRAALKAFRLPWLKIKTNDLSGVDKNIIFRGKHLLEIIRAPEPETVRWQDLNETFKVRESGYMIGSPLLSYSQTSYSSCSNT